MNNNRTFSKKNLLIGLTFITGLCALAYQMIWQHYFSILIGSGARSTTIVVACFLACLSAGNFIFGKLTVTVKGRSELTKYYGFIEFVIGSYAFFFPTIFDLVLRQKFIIFDNIGTQIFIVLLIISVPAILMGATIPILTKTLPENSSTINQTHSLIYGMNTIGAFLGCLLGGLFFIPKFGLPLSLNILGMINIICSMFYIKNNLLGDGFEELKNEPDVIYPKSSLYLLAFTTGLISISLEIIWIRLTALTIGNSILVSPFVISLFILGIGLGSITVKSVSFNNFKRQLMMSQVTIVFSFLIIPFLPLWVSNIRALLVNYPINFYIFNFLSYCLLGLFIVPFTFFQGRLLPYVYALYPKTSKNYGKFCGNIYAVNTIGTFLGSIGLGHLALYYFNIDQIYKLLCLVSIIILTCFTFQPLQKISIKNMRPLLLILFLFSNWDRTYHHLGLFRTNKLAPYNFNGVFNIVSDHGMKLMYFRDGPNSTIAVMKNPNNSLSIINNGKSDGNTVADYGTTSLLAAIPYLYLNQEDQIKAAVIGAGTGITAGILGQFRDVKQVDLLEISREVIEAQILFKEFNHNLINNPKVKIHVLDAFQHFKSVNKKYHIIVSEPPNPWTVGVENLFTTYFYETVKKSLESNGIFIQWIHLYSMNPKILLSVFENALKIFPEASVYQTLEGDIAILLQQEKDKMNFLSKRFNESITQEVFKKNNLPFASSIELLKIFTKEQLMGILDSNFYLSHEIFSPSLSSPGAKAFFLNERVVLNNLLNPYIARKYEEKKFDEKEKLVMKHLNYLKDKQKNSFCTDDKESYYSLLCVREHLFVSFLHWSTSKDPLVKLKEYPLLRKEGIIASDPEFLASFYIKDSFTLEHKIAALEEMKKDQDKKSAQKYCKQLALSGEIKEEQCNNI